MDRGGIVAHRDGAGASGVAREHRESLDAAGAARWRGRGRAGWAALGPTGSGHAAWQTAAVIPAHRESRGAGEDGSHGKRSTKCTFAGGGQRERVGFGGNGGGAGN